jgi:hypothetical protein
MSAKLTLQQVPGNYSLCRLPVAEPLPDWAQPANCKAGAFYTLTCTASEISVVCESQLVPADVQHQAGWALLQIAEVLDLQLTGITAQFSAALAKAGVNLCVIATFDTDYILVPLAKIETAISALVAAGFIIKS